MLIKCQENVDHPCTSENKFDPDLKLRQANILNLNESDKTKKKEKGKMHANIIENPNLTE